MAEYSFNSLRKLDTAHPDLIILFKEVIRIFDNTILFGNRSKDLQFDLFKKGRSNVEGYWVVTSKKEVVTYCDGTKNKSNHNYTPSRAVDSVPYPIDWKDTNRMYYFAGHVKAIAIILKAQGKITHNIIWGGDWNQNTMVNDQTFMDLAHYELDLN